MEMLDVRCSFALTYKSDTIHWFKMDGSDSVEKSHIKSRPENDFDCHVLYLNAETCVLSD